MSANRKTITILTSPSASTKSLPPFPGARASPTTGAPKQYRIEERKRTVYVTSDLDPSEWNAENLDAVFNLAAAQQGEHERPGSQPMRRAKSLVETQFIITEDTDAAYQAAGGLSPSTSSHSQGRRGVKSTGHLYAASVASPDSPRRSRPRILFYHKHDPHYGFTNFSAHPITYMGKRYPTSEHLFQSFKFHGHRPNLAEHIRTCSERPSVAFSEARRFQPEVRHDWSRVNIEKMDEVLWHKFTQHLDLKAELLATGDAELVEDSDKDAFWGVGSDRKGRNELGKALERLRSKLRQ